MTHTYHNSFDYWCERALWWARVYRDDTQYGYTQSANHALLQSQRCTQYAMEVL